MGGEARVWTVGQQAGLQATVKLERLAKVSALYEEKNEDSGDLRRAK